MKINIHDFNTEPEKPASASISQLAGAWKDWNEKEFEDFLQVIREIRNDLFEPRNFNF